MPVEVLSTPVYAPIAVVNVPAPVFLPFRLAPATQADVLVVALVAALARVP